MLEKSVTAIDGVIRRLEHEIKDNEQTMKLKTKMDADLMERNWKLINDPKVSSVRQLRALISTVIEGTEELNLHREHSALLLTIFFATSVRVFQEEVAFELDVLRTKSASKTAKNEEMRKYAKIEKDLQRMKRTMDTEWKPLMNSLRNEIDRRSKYLNEKR